MRRTAFIIFFISCCINLHAQSNVDVEDIFKLQLFLDKKNTIHSSTKDVVKDDSLYQVFSNSIKLTIDTLKVESQLYDFIDPFKYYRIDLRAVVQKLSSNDTNIQSLSLFHGLNTTCVLAISPKTGLAYRLQGFNGNDFLTFLQDLKEVYRKEASRNISNSKLFKKYKLPEVSFKCLYTGLRARNIDTKKYPCLIRYSDPVQIE